MDIMPVPLRVWMLNAQRSREMVFITPARTKGLSQLYLNIINRLAIDIYHELVHLDMCF